ncbi:MAG: GNAT family N-acetyltransferase [Acidobacteria bacterium]|nr:GNAT family N-acetyltransferase [Acidobacteriota bacterium]
MTIDSFETIVSFLKKDELKNMNMLYFMENNPIQSLDKISNSIVLRGNSDHQWVYISTPNTQELGKVVRTLTKNDKFFAVIEDWMLPLLTAGKTLVWQLSTMKLVLPQHVMFGRTTNSRIVPLTVHDAQYVYEHSLYQGVTSPGYIRDRIRKGISVGIHESGKLVAWAMTHDDSAIGLLHVLDAYRRRGYAYELTVHLVHELRKQGKIPFVHIEEANLKSMHLAIKSGFRKDRNVLWFEVQ